MIAKQSILALDIATRMGFAFGRPGETPVSGSIRLASGGSTNGAKGRGMTRWLIPFLREHKPDLIYYEVPIDPRHMGKKTTFATARILLGLPFLLETLAEEMGVFDLYEVGVQDVRKHFLGVARPKEKKAAVMARCRELGWPPVDDNAGDALALWDFACAHAAPSSSIASTPMFAEPPRADQHEYEEAPF